MEGSNLFVQWAMTMIPQEQQAATIHENCGEVASPSIQALSEATQAAEMVQELMAQAHPTNSRSSGESSSVGNNIMPPTVMDAGTRPSSPNLAAKRGRIPSRIGGDANSPVNWNFRAAAAQPCSDETAVRRGLNDFVYASLPERKACLKSSRSMAALYAQEHIIAERKRRERINQRFIELSSVIPGLKKMDKATILSDATTYVKELQGKLKDLQANRGSNGRSKETVVVIKRPCLHAASAATSRGHGSPFSASSGTQEVSNKQLLDVEARLSEKSVMVRIHCKNGKAVVAKVLAEMEELHLSIVHANVMPFSACTLIITITAKVAEGFNVTVEDIIGRLDSVLLDVQQP